MGIVTASELKTRGIAAIEEVVSAAGGAILSVRGERRYVTVSVEDYMHLRSCELEAARQEVESDLAGGGDLCWGHRRTRPQTGYAQVRRRLIFTESCNISAENWPRHHGSHPLRVR